MFLGFGLFNKVSVYLFIFLLGVGGAEYGSLCAVLSQKNPEKILPKNSSVINVRID